MFAVLLLNYPSLTAKGVRDGLNLCAQVIIPSLFPFMVLCSFVTKSDICAEMQVLAKTVMRLLFKLPGDAFPAVIMGLVGGYPVGACMTAQLYKNKRLTHNQACRMMSFCVNSGPAFTIGAVGSAMLGSRRTGMIIFASLLISSLLIGFFSRFTDDGGVMKFSAPPPSVDYREAVVSSISDAAQSMLSVCSWIVLFGCICSLLTLMPKTASLPFKCLLEVSSGCIAAVEYGLEIPLITAMLGWSGLSVHCQIMPQLQTVKMPLTIFWATRLLNGGLAAAVCMGLMRLFPCGISAMSNFTTANVNVFSVSAPATAGLMIMCALLILDLDMERKM